MNANPAAIPTINASSLEFRSEPRSFYDLGPVELKSLLADWGFSPSHYKDLFRKAYRDLSPTPWVGAPIPKRLAALMAAHITTDGLYISASHVSPADQTQKLQVCLRDGKQIETIVIPEKNRLTLCVSSQVGCAQGCTFCQTARMGLVRQLDVGEIVGQIVIAQQFLRQHPEQMHGRDPKVSNVVFMGMGEPLDNVKAVIAAIEIMQDPYGLGLAPRKITISTAGHLPGLDYLSEHGPKVGIAISLHEPVSRQRSQLMPINRLYPIDAVMAKLREYCLTHRRTLFVQYTLIKNVNDSHAHAAKLVELVAGISVKVNLIPFNRVVGSRFERPDIDHVLQFYHQLRDAGLTTMIRFSKGEDIFAACGQLIKNT